MRVLVVGAGPAGIMASLSAAMAGHKVILLEKNSKIGRKLYISGKGRCNVTNIRPDFLKHVVTNPKFLHSALTRFSPLDTIDFFKNLGLETSIERGGRVFPISNKSTDVIDALFLELKRLKVDIHFDEKLTSIFFENKKILKIETNRSTYQVDHYILALGGASYPATGSDGLWLEIIERMGILTIEFKPALSSLVLDYKNLPQGLSLKNVEATILDKFGKKICSEFGEMVFTDNGVSGPIVLTLTSKVNRIFDKNSFKLDLKPALPYNLLEERIIRDIMENKNKNIRSILNLLLPARLVDIVLEKTKIKENFPGHSITRVQRKSLVEQIKNLSFDILSLGNIANSIVTSGGVCVNEIDPKNMVHKRYANLSFAGEMIDVDALTGGYNIQIALSTGWLAGKQVPSENK